MKPSAKSRQNILDIAAGEIPEQELSMQERSTRVLTGADCSPASGGDRKKGCGCRKRLDPMAGIRKFSPRCDL